MSAQPRPPVERTRGERHDRVRTGSRAQDAGLMVEAATGLCTIVQPDNHARNLPSLAHPLSHGAITRTKERE